MSGSSVLSVHYRPRHCFFFCWNRRSRHTAEPPRPPNQPSPVALCADGQPGSVTALPQPQPQPALPPGPRCSPVPSLLPAETHVRGCLPIQTSEELAAPSTSRSCGDAGHERCGTVCSVSRARCSVHADPGDGSVSISVLNRHIHSLRKRIRQFEEHFEQEKHYKVRWSISCFSAEFFSPPRVSS